MPAMSPQRTSVRDTGIVTSQSWGLPRGCSLTRHELQSSAEFDIHQWISKCNLDLTAAHHTKAALSRTTMLRVLLLSAVIHSLDAAASAPGESCAGDRAELGPETTWLMPCD
jgi:hypothetical protein